MIEVEHLTKHYGSVAAVNDISFTVGKGEILGFLGPNGAGKTTTMRMLTCYMPPSSGTARVAGFDVFEESIEVRRRIGYLPEHPPLYNEMTVCAYLDFVAKIKGVDATERKTRVGEVIDRCGLHEVAGTIVKKLSKGYRQRVGIAQAIIHNPPVLILDEPTIGLDPRQIIEVRGLIKRLAGDHTVILSTHILPEVSMTCERVVIINKGTIVAMDTPANLTARLKGTERTFVAVDGHPDEVLSILREINGVLSVSYEPQKDGKRGHGFWVESRVDTDIRADLAARVVNNHFGLLELRPVEMSLEDIFLQLITTEEEAN
jgi:ABC-2 type transport system ATP-binding protein